MKKTLIYALLLECLVVATGVAVEKSIGVSDHLMSSHAFGTSGSQAPATQAASMGIAALPNNEK